MRLFRKAVRPIQDFFRLEAAGGALLFLAALAAVVWANADIGSYLRFVDYPLALGAGATLVDFTFKDVVNDGLMAVFFFVVGMEIKRELVAGELATLSKASLPVLAALGGMLVPAGIFLAFTHGQAGAVGWGVPMATDIAFCMGILALLKGRVPRALVVFLTALAIFDDIGGILVIAIFYADGVGAVPLAFAAALSVAAFVVGRAHVTNAWVYALLGALLWYAFHHAGIHATIAGVVLGLAIPARQRTGARDVLDALSRHVLELLRIPVDRELGYSQVLAIEQDLERLEIPVERFIHALHRFVAFFVLPLFALTNSGIYFGDIGSESLAAPVTLGVAVGLLVGKPVGIFSVTWLAVRMGIAPMPTGSSLRQLFAVSVLAGVGFTVALFIAMLAYPGAPELLDQAKVGIVGGSLVAGAAGFAILRVGSGRSRAPAA